MGSSCTCFNGAVDERRRREPTARTATLADGRLQWSRRRTSTESFGRWRCERQGTAPLQWSRRRTSTESSSVAEVAERVGALQWSRRRTSTERTWKLRSASMALLLQWSRRRTSTESPSSRMAGQWCRRCFNGAVDERRRRARSLQQEQQAQEQQLQWSRRRTSTERRGTDERRPRSGGASMEPSTNVDGELHLGRDGFLMPDASMEPSTNVDGERRRRRRRRRRYTSFNGAVDERRRRAAAAEAAASAIYELQWSRRRTSTERVAAT